MPAVVDTPLHQSSGRSALGVITGLRSCCQRARQEKKEIGGRRLIEKERKGKESKMRDRERKYRHDWRREGGTETLTSVRQRQSRDDETIEERRKEKFQLYIEKGKTERERERKRKPK